MLRLLIDRQQRRLPRPRIFRDRFDPLDSMQADLFFERHRFTKEVVIIMCQDVFENHLRHPTYRNNSLPVSIQVCTALRYFAQGGHLSLIGDSTHISKTSTYRCIMNVASILSNHLSKYVYFDNFTLIKNRFYETYNFPRVIGVIDGTHVRIKKPSTNEHVYVNRKLFHSVNVMLVCGQDLKIFNCVARFPGGCHDAFILSSSRLGQHFEITNPEGWLLGDAGYPCKTWLLTPLDNVTSESESNYQTCHVRTRNTIERCNGLLKQRFRCLRNGIHFEPRNACVIINACVVLHNIALMHNQAVPSTDDWPVEENEDMEGNVNINDAASGRQIRRELIQNMTR